MDKLLPTGKIQSFEDLAKIVRARRKKHGLTQKDLAGLTMTGPRFIVELEQAKPTLQVGKTLTVLAALGLDLYVKER